MNVSDIERIIMATAIMRALVNSGIVIANNSGLLNDAVKIVAKTLKETNPAQDPA